MEVISYVNENRIATVGFKDKGLGDEYFVVYSSVPFINGEAREKLLQRAYIEAKEAIEYERTLDKHSFTTEEVGEEFVPDEPRVSSIISEPIDNIIFDKDQEEVTIELDVKAHDQYGDVINREVTYASSKGVIDGNSLTLSHPESPETVTLELYLDDVLEQVTFEVLPYIQQPMTPEEAELKLLKAQLEANDERIDFQEELIVELAMMMYQ